MLAVTKLERKESIKVYKKLILVIQFKSKKFSFLYKIVEIKKNRLRNGIHNEIIRL